MKSKLSRSGQPSLGTVIEIRLEDQTWIPVKVVAKVFGKQGSGQLVGVALEEVEAPYTGQRFPGLIDWPDMVERGSWRALDWPGLSFEDLVAGKKG